MNMIETSHLSYDYIRHDEEGNVEGTTRAVSDVTLSVKPGDFVAILGHNGSGKSTLAKVIAGMYGRFEGTITCGGKNVRRMTRQEFTDTVAIIPQSPFLFNGTVLENITLFCDKWTEAEVLSAARQAGLGDLLAALPPASAWSRVTRAAIRTNFPAGSGSASALPGRCCENRLFSLQMNPRRTWTAPLPMTSKAC